MNGLLERKIKKGRMVLLTCTPVSQNRQDSGFSTMAAQQQGDAGGTPLDDLSRLDSDLEVSS